MSQDPIIYKLLSFIKNQGINLIEDSKSLYRLPDTQEIPTKIYLKLDTNPEIIIRLLGPEYQKLPESVTQELPNYDYIETGAFKIKLELNEKVFECLNEISTKIQEFFSHITPKARGLPKSLFNNRLISHQRSKINSIKNFQPKRLTYRVNKQKYLNLNQIEETFWLGDLIFIAQPNGLNENINVTCMLENEETREIMVLKSIEDLSAFEKFEEVFFEFGLIIHQNFTIDQRIFDFFCDHIKDWKKFSISNKFVGPDGKLTVSYWYENNVIREHDIKKEDLNSPRVFLTNISGQAQYFSESFRGGISD